MQTFGEYLEALRGKMSLREAAKRIGISHTYIRDLELGKKTDPSRETLKKIAEAYDHPYLELWEKAGYTPIDVPFVGNKEDLDKFLEQHIENRKEKVKSKDIVQLLQTDDVYYNGLYLTEEDKKDFLNVLEIIMKNRK